MRLSKGNRGLARAFDITEKPMPLRAWDSEDAVDLIASIESGIRKLMRERAELELSLSEKERQHASDTQRFLLRVLEVIDGFEQLLEHVSAGLDGTDRQIRTWIDSFRTVYRLLKSVVREQGVVETEILDWSFDPRWHRVVETVADPSRADGTILRQTQKGYLWHNELLRKAEVIVVRNSKED